MVPTTNQEREGEGERVRRKEGDREGPGSEEKEMRLLASIC